MSVFPAKIRLVLLLFVTVTWLSKFTVTCAPSSLECADFDVVVWGGTVCGATAAVAVARTSSRTLRVAWLVNATRLGGMTSGGLGGVDRAMSMGGLAEELLGPLGREFEPHVAETAVESFLSTAGDSVTVFRQTLGVQSVAVNVMKDGAKQITALVTVSGVAVCGAVFIDCSYEGDVLRLSGSDYAVGREGPSAYNESMGGSDVHLPAWAPDEKPSAFDASVSPFVSPQNTTLLPTVHAVYGLPACTDQLRSGNKNLDGGDSLVMAYCFRMCLTNNASNRIPISRPDGYSRDAVELLRRQLVAQSKQGAHLTMSDLFLIRELPNRKIDLNSGQFSASGRSGGFAPFSTDLPFAQYDWPTGNASVRMRVFDTHKWWTQTILYYLSNDEELKELQPALVAEMASWGLAADEFPESADRWTPQLYVRESIRLRGARVLTQNDVWGHAKGSPVESSVGLSKWGVDIHAVQRLAVKDTLGTSWIVANAGGRDSGRAHTIPGVSQLSEIPYDALIPRRNDTVNLLVPVCASFTHVAFSTYRLETQYAIFGHSSGTAAALAVAAARASGNVSVIVQDVNMQRLQGMLLMQKQLIHINQITTDA